MSIEVECKVKVYEVNGDDKAPLPHQTVRVLSHWNRDSLVVVELGGFKVTVDADDLHRAITNASNRGRL